MNNVSYWIPEYEEYTKTSDIFEKIESSDISEDEKTLFKSILNDIPSVKLTALDSNQQEDHPPALITNYWVPSPYLPVSPMIWKGELKAASLIFDSYEECFNVCYEYNETMMATVNGECTIDDRSSKEYP